MMQHLQRLHVSIIFYRCAARSSHSKKPPTAIGSDTQRRNPAKVNLKLKPNTHTRSQRGCSCSDSYTGWVGVCVCVCQLGSQQVRKSNSKISSDSFHFIMHIAHTRRTPYTLRALVWRKIVNFPLWKPADMCILQICINPGKMFALSLSRCRCRCRFHIRGRFAYCQLCLLIYMHEILL